MLLELITVGKCLECELNSALHLHDLLEQLADVSLLAIYDFNTCQHLYTWLRIRLALHGNLEVLFHCESTLLAELPARARMEHTIGSGTRAVMRATPDISTGIVPAYGFESIGI